MKTPFTLLGGDAILLSMKSRNIIPWVWAALALLLGSGALVYFTRNLHNDVPTQSVEALRPGVDVELRDVRFSETRSGVRKYLLEADSATYSATGVSKIQRIAVRFFDRDGRETMRMRADEGDFSGTSQQATVRGSVVLNGAKGLVLETDHLTYDKGSDLLVTDAVVRLSSPQGRLSGRGLVLHPQQEKLSLLHDVSGEFGGTISSSNDNHGDS